MLRYLAFRCAQSARRPAAEDLKILLFLQERLSHTEMLRLYQNAHAYVSPFSWRISDLGTLEAMAMGLQAWNSTMRLGMHL